MLLLFAEKQLKIALEETQSQLAMLKAEMQNCTAELRDSTNAINKLKSNKEALQNKIRQMGEKEKSLVQQVKKSHERCQAMQTEIEFANKLSKMFESEVCTEFTALIIFDPILKLSVIYHQKPNERKRPVRDGN